MTTLREVAQQALEALETYERDGKYLDVCRPAIRALRAALAQPLPDPVDEYRKGFIDGQIDMRDRPEEQEPVAWWIPKAEQFCIKQPGERPFAKAWEPLYTHPPRREWRSLSEEEIEDMSVTGTDSELRRQQFARAIEAALKEKNNG